MQPPRDLRHSSAAERSNAMRQCDVALQWAYDVLAETFNSSDVHPADCDVDAPDVPDAADSEPSFLAMPTLDGFCEWIHGPGATVTATGADSGAVVKWLLQCTSSTSLRVAKHRCNQRPATLPFSDATM